MLGVSDKRKNVFMLKKNLIGADVDIDIDIEIEIDRSRRSS